MRILLSLLFFASLFTATANAAQLYKVTVSKATCTATNTWNKQACEGVSHWRYAEVRLSTEPGLVFGEKRMISKFGIYINAQREYPVSIEGSSVQRYEKLVISPDETEFTYSRISERDGYNHSISLEKIQTSSLRFQKWHLKMSFKQYQMGSSIPSEVIIEMDLY